MSEQYYVNVRDTFTERIEKVEVSREVYEAYTRGLYQMRYNDRKFYGHETVISEWKADDEIEGDDYAGFESSEKDPMIQTFEHESYLKLLAVIDRLAPMMQRRFKMMYLQGIPRKRIAEIEGVSEGVIRDSLRDARKRIIKLMKNMEEGEMNG